MIEVMCQTLWQQLAFLHGTVITISTLAAHSNVASYTVRLFSKGPTKPVLSVVQKVYRLLCFMKYKNDMYLIQKDYIVFLWQCIHIP